MASKKATPAPIINFPLSVGGQNVLIGQQISINLKAGAYYGVGDIWLTPTRYWATVPNGMAEKDYAVIHKGLENGLIVRGKVFIPPVDKIAGTLDDYWLTVQKNGIGTKTKDKFRELALKKNWADGGYTFMEIALYCIKQEEGTKHRGEVINWLKQMLEQAEGPLRLYEPPSDEEGIVGPVIETLDKDHPEQQIALGQTARKPSRHKGGNKTTSEALGSILD